MHKSTKKMAKRLKFPAEFLNTAVFFSFFENFCKYCTVESKIVCRIRQNAKRKRKKTKGTQCLKSKVNALR